MLYCHATLILNPITSTILPKPTKPYTDKPANLIRDLCRYIYEPTRFRADLPIENNPIASTILLELDNDSANTPAIAIDPYYSIYS